jgi:hypothetical protein
MTTIRETSLPGHVATDDEPIPAVRGRPFDGPDLRFVTPIPDMLAELGRFHDDAAGYVDRFREYLDEAGIDVSLMIDGDGTEDMMVGGRCDGQMRHRSRWIHFLFDDLDRKDGRRSELRRQLWCEGRCADNRLVTPRETTTAIRDFLRSDGRILVTPDGHLTEGGAVPRAFIHGSEDDVAECVRASRAYFDLSLRRRAREHIKRAARMLGTRTGNGWLVLERRRDAAEG